MKRLIVTADDVGLHRGMTDGAIHAHLHGIVTACSIVANGAAFEHAVDRLREVPTLKVGVHLTLVEERPLAEDVSSLVSSNGLLHEHWTSFAPRYFARLISMDDVERELRAQLERVLATGLPVTHVNGHQHLHLLPRIFKLVSRLADEYAIPYIRIVDDHGSTVSRPPIATLSRRPAIAALSALGRRARSSRTNTRTIGVADAGHLTSLTPLFDHIDDLTELVCHPGLGDASLADAYDWDYSWDAETQALCDPTLRGELAKRGVALG
ncbi:MAG: ChbG/HpnK family deacetylase [Acidobacteria bacterium]|nr:ChbG/HpnK family deacetylase [Acidobacteriota bacterium]